MNSNDRNQKRIDATEDDDFGEFEGPEDDAPESVQAMGGPPNWVFPDLLRVQSKQSSHEEPESVANSSMSSIQIRPNVLNRVNDIRGATGRETGAIPKQRALDPPDVSLLTSSSQSKLPTTLDLCSSAFNTSSYSRDNASVIGSVSSQSSSSLNRPTNLMSDIGSSHNGIDNQSRINQLESDLKQMQTQKQLLQQQLLQKDTQIRELQSHSRQSALNMIPMQSQDSLITGLTESLDKFRSNIETAMSRLEQRLTSLETRISETNVNSVGFPETMPSNSSNDLQNGSQTLTSLLAHQKRDFEDQKRQNLLLFSSILKNALETLENHLDVKPSDSNHI